jgi:hypothetical protein
LSSLAFEKQCRFAWKRHCRSAVRRGSALLAIGGKDDGSCESSLADPKQWHGELAPRRRISCHCLANAVVDVTWRVVIAGVRQAATLGVVTSFALSNSTAAFFDLGLRADFRHNESVPSWSTSELASSLFRSFRPEDISMTTKMLRALGRKLVLFHERFARRLGRRESRSHVLVYLKGLLMGEVRKNVERIALRFGESETGQPVGLNDVLARQDFLTDSPWDPREVQQEIQVLFAEQLVPTTGVADRDGGCDR